MLCSEKNGTIDRGQGARNGVIKIWQGTHEAWSLGVGLTEV